MRTAVLTLLILVGFATSTQAQTTCCLGSTGNIDCDPASVVDITDLTVLIDHLFISLSPLCCVEAANIDGDASQIVDITDLTFLIDHLFISLGPTATCLAAVSIVVVPDSGMPGNILTVTGIIGDTAKPDRYAVVIGTEPAPFRILPNGDFEVVLPLFLDSTLWPSPPAGAQTVEIRLNGALIGEAVNALTVVPLPRATGTTQEILTSGERFITAMAKLYELMPVTDSVEIHVRQAGLAAWTALLSQGDSSLTAILDGSSPLMTGITPDFDLTDALLASSGVKDYLLRLTSGFSSLVDSAIYARSAGIPVLCRGGGADMDIACGMQVYEVARDWRIQVLNEVQKGFDAITSINGLIGLSGKSVPHVALVSAVLYVMEMLYDRNLLAYLPSQVTAFELAMASDTIEVDEYTSSTMVIRASNQPLTLTLEDIINDALKLLPLGSKDKNEFVTTFKAFFENVAKYALGKYRDVLIASGSFGAIEVGQTPLIPYIAQVTNPDLVVLFSSDEGIIIGDETAFEWRGVSRGPGRVEARSRGPGLRSKVLNDHALCLGCVYSGAAFGNNAPSTGLVSVPVGHKYNLDLSITGLPAGVDGDVGLLWPDGNFGAYTVTTTVKGLDPGDYSITALPVTGSDGKEYVPDPDAQTVTVVAGTGNNATVDYGPKYGSLLLAIPGLPAGADADIDITGPNSYSKHIVAEGLIDSLVRGDYSISAHPITDGGKTLSPDPASQSVAIIGGETATAAVAYSGEVSLDVFVGYRPTSLFSRMITKALSTSVVYLSPLETSADTLFIDSFLPGDCGPIGPSGGGTYQSSASTTYSSGNVSGTISKVSKNVVSITVSAVGSSSFPSPDGVGSTGCGDFLAAPGFVVLDITNPSGNPVEVEFAWGYTGALAGNSSWQARMSMITPYPCGENYFGQTDLFFITNLGGDSLSGSQIITVSGANPQIGLSFIFSACANSNYASPITGSASINGSFLVNVRPVPAQE